MGRIANGRFSKRQSEDIARRFRTELHVFLLMLIAFAGQPFLYAADDPSARSPKDWATDAATGELEILLHPSSYLRYRMHVVDLKGDQVRDVIESKDGTVARLILRDGRALSADEDMAEQGRLNDILASPERYARHAKSDSEGKHLASDLVRLMPEAMIFTYTPGQPQSGQHQGGIEIVVDYEPNPKWSPPSTTSEALTGLEGRLWIDGKTRRMVRMEGQVFKPVNFGWGMLAHIYPGGKLELEQTNAVGGRWIYTHYKQDVSVRALMVKTLRAQTEIWASDFSALPRPLSVQDSIRLLLATPLPAR